MWLKDCDLDRILSCHEESKTPFSRRFRALVKAEREFLTLRGTALFEARVSIYDNFEP